MSTVLYTLIYRILYNKLFLGEDILENPLYRTMIENHTYIKSVCAFEACQHNIRHHEHDGRM